jgi:hypothetical protein
VIVESRTSLRETKKIQIKLATTCNKNEQQDGRNTAEIIDQMDEDDLEGL